MSEKGVVKGEARLIRKVVFTYRLEDDPKGEDRTLTLEHGGGGEAIDGLIWSDELIRKLAYLERDGCREVQKEKGTGDWKVYSAQNASGFEGNCLWMHDPNCLWWEYCSDS